MNKMMLNALLGVLISSSMVYSAESILDVEHVSIPTVKPTPMGLPTGDTAPATPVITVPTPPTAAKITPTVLTGTARLYGGSLSADEKFLSITFINDKGKTHPETIANNLLSLVLSDRKSMVSARQIFTYVVNKAKEKKTTSKILSVLLNCGKSLRHVASIRPSSVEQVFGGMISDKPTTYHLDLLETSKALFETGLELATNYKHYSQDYFEDALISTNSHLAETKIKVAEQIREEKEKERAAARLEAEREERRTIERAVEERNEKLLRLQQQEAESKELERNRNQVIKKLHKGELKNTPDGEKYRELNKKINNKNKIGEKDFVKAQIELENLIKKYLS